MLKQGLVENFCLILYYSAVTRSIELIVNEDFLKLTKS